MWGTLVANIFKYIYIFDTDIFVLSIKRVTALHIYCSDDRHARTSPKNTEIYR
jgi:hypothetical protein